MEKPFWLHGPVPLARLTDFALPRPATMEAVVARLATRRYAVLTGPPGSGKSTLAHQVAAAMGLRTVIVSSSALLLGDEDEHRRAIAAELLDPAAVARPWADLGLAGNDLLVLDGIDLAANAWVEQLPARIPAAVLAIAGDGASPPDAVATAPLGRDECGAFLQSRGRRAGCSWTSAALDKAVELADGSPALLHHVGMACVEVALEQRRHRVDLDTFVEAAYRAAASPPSWISDLVQATDGPRARLAKALVRYPEGTPTEWARRCGLEPKAAVVHLARLVAQGVLQRSGRGEYRIALPLLALHLQVRYGTVVHVLGAKAPLRPGA